MWRVARHTGKAACPEKQSVVLGKDPPDWPFVAQTCLEPVATVPMGTSGSPGRQALGLVGSSWEKADGSPLAGVPGGSNREEFLRWSAWCRSARARLGQTQFRRHSLHTRGTLSREVLVDFSGMGERPARKPGLTVWRWLCPPDAGEALGWPDGRTRAGGRSSGAWGTQCPDARSLPVAKGCGPWPAMPWRGHGATVMKMRGARSPTVAVRLRKGSRTTGHGNPVLCVFSPKEVQNNGPAGPRGCVPPRVPGTLPLSTAGAPRPAVLPSRGRHPAQERPLCSPAPRGDGSAGSSAKPQQAWVLQCLPQAPAASGPHTQGSWRPKPVPRCATAANRPDPVGQLCGALLSAGSRGHSS